MKTVFDQSTREELVGRTSSLEASCRAQWGKMNIYQMLKHCRMWEEMIFGKQKYKRQFLGFLFGKMVLKTLIKDEKPLKRNTPTITELKVTGDGDVDSEKIKWIALIEQYDHLSTIECDHPFFGKINKEQIGILAYKHADHHLRQFNK